MPCNQFQPSGEFRSRDRTFNMYGGILSFERVKQISEIVAAIISSASFVISSQSLGIKKSLCKSKVNKDFFLSVALQEDRFRISKLFFKSCSVLVSCSKQYFEFSLSICAAARVHLSETKLTWAQATFQLQFQMQFENCIVEYFCSFKSA